MYGMLPPLPAPVAATLLAAALAFPAAAVSAAEAPEPAYLQVAEDEWSLVLSRTSVKAGLVILETVNYGMDDHDLALRRRANSSRTYRMPRIAKKARAEREFRLAAGTYTLWCTLPGHRARGMKATLRVLPRSVT